MYRITIYDRKTDVATVRAFNLKEDAQTSFLQECAERGIPEKSETTVRQAFDVWDDLDTEADLEIKVSGRDWVMQLDEFEP